MEIVGRRRAIDHLHVVLAAELQVTLDPARGVLRPLSLEAVGQKHHQPAHAQPLGLARGDELVDDDLGAIGEIAELRLPQHQHVGFGGGIAVFEAEHGGLGQGTVDDIEGRLVPAQVIERDEALLRLLVDEHGMAL